MGWSCPRPDPPAMQSSVSHSRTPVRPALIGRGSVGDAKADARTGETGAGSTSIRPMRRLTPGHAQVPARACTPTGVPPVCRPDPDATIRPLARPSPPPDLDRCPTRLKLPDPARHVPPEAHTDPQPDCDHLSLHTSGTKVAAGPAGAPSAGFAGGDDVDPPDDAGLGLPLPDVVGRPRWTRPVPRPGCRRTTPPTAPRRAASSAPASPASTTAKASSRARSSPRSTCGGCSACCRTRSPAQQLGQAPPAHRTTGRRPPRHDPESRRRPSPVST